MIAYHILILLIMILRYDFPFLQLILLFHQKNNHFSKLMHNGMNELMLKFVVIMVFMLPLQVGMNKWPKIWKYLRKKKVYLIDES